MKESDYQVAEPRESHVLEDVVSALAASTISTRVIMTGHGQVQEKVLNQLMVLHRGP